MEIHNMDNHLPRAFNKSAKTGDRKVISSTKVNDKVVRQQVVYVGNGVSFTRHERVKWTTS